MTDHPLTNRAAEKIAHTAHWSKDVEDVVFMHDDMRAAADWQLEQVMEWLEFGYQADPNLSREIKRRGGFKTIAIFLEKAMRPQVVDLPQANSDVCGEEGMERARQQTLEENDELMRLLSDS